MLYLCVQPETPSLVQFSRLIVISPRVCTVGMPRDGRSSRRQQQRRSLRRLSCTLFPISVWTAIELAKQLVRWLYVPAALCVCGYAQYISGELPYNDGMKTSASSSGFISNHCCQYCNYTYFEDLKGAMIFQLYTSGIALQLSSSYIHNCRAESNLHVSVVNAKWTAEQ